jgi:hypothetical protein
MLKTLVDRFHAHILAPTWDRAQPQLQHCLRDLERILAVLHPRIEYPAPLLEDWVQSSANTTINSTSEQDITGATITVTPEVDTRYLVSAYADTTCSALGAFGHAFSFRLKVNGVVQSHRSNWTPHVATERDTLGHSWTVLVTAGVATTIKLCALTSDAASTYLVNGNNSGFTIASFPLSYRLP